MPQKLAKRSIISSVQHCPEPNKQSEIFYFGSLIPTEAECVKNSTEDNKNILLDNIREATVPK